MGLPKTQTHASIQGISSVNTETYHSVSFNSRSRHTDWHTTLNCAILSHITATTPSTKLDIRTWKIPKDIKLADEQFFNQETLIYSLELTYSMICFDQAERHAVAITQFYKRQFLAGHYHVEHQPPLHSMTHSLYFCSEKTTIWSTF